MIPLQNIIPSYLYVQYSDDQDLQAFISSYNNITQGYLNWFNQNPLAVYTSPNIGGQLLDIIGYGVYGIKRPVTATQGTLAPSSYALFPYSKTPYAGHEKVITGLPTPVNDDIYKRTLTWFTYLADGKQMNMTWLKRRFARFVYGTAGSDVTADAYMQVSIKQSSVAGIYTVTLPASSTVTTMSLIFTSLSSILPVGKTFTITS